jgi:hypothetical protein
MASIGVFCSIATTNRRIFFGTKYRLRDAVTGGFAFIYLAVVVGVAVCIGITFTRPVIVFRYSGC